jgi:hypothetical protein
VVVVAVVLLLHPHLLVKIVLGALSLFLFRRNRTTFWTTLEKGWNEATSFAAAALFD